MLDRQVPAYSTGKGLLSGTGNLDDGDSRLKARLHLSGEAAAFTGERRKRGREPEGHSTPIKQQEVPGLAVLGSRSPDFRSSWLPRLKVGKPPGAGTLWGGVCIFGSQLLGLLYKHAVYL